MKEDSYKTIAKPSKGIFKDRGSKFLAFAYPVISEEEIKKILIKLKKDYYDARHLCFAYRLGVDKKIYRTNDDGEPSNSAGQPIFGQIKSKNLTNLLIVVIRYFGSALLGKRGLINAYSSATADALKNAVICFKTVNNVYEISFDHKVMNDVMRVIKEEKLKPVNQQFELNCSITISIRQSLVDRILKRLRKINTVEIQLINNQ